MKQESTNSKTNLAIVEYRKSGLSDFKKQIKIVSNYNVKNK